MLEKPLWLKILQVMQAFFKSHFKKFLIDSYCIKRQNLGWPRVLRKSTAVDGQKERQRQGIGLVDQLFDRNYN